MLTAMNTIIIAAMLWVVHCNSNTVDGGGHNTNDVCTIDYVQLNKLHVYVCPLTIYKSAI